MTETSARLILHSRSSNDGANADLVTMVVRYWKPVHPEHLRHRAQSFLREFELLDWEPDFSYSVSSSRAIPTRLYIEEARDPDKRAGPTWWGAAQPGMTPANELDDEERVFNWPLDLPLDLPFGISTIVASHLVPEVAETITRRELAKRLWDLAGRINADIAEVMDAVAGAHKSITNRILDPYVHVRALVSGTTPAWMNFFGLRGDAAADATMRALSDACWEVWNDGHPVQVLRPGEWHLPFVDELYWYEALTAASEPESRDLVLDRRWQHEDLMKIIRKISAACCAHLSYESFETGKRMTVKHCVALADRFVTSVPRHASPMEHQATPDVIGPVFHTAHSGYHGWHNLSQAGNLGPGWRQWRKMLPGEAVAPLPERYR